MQNLGPSELLTATLVVVTIVYVVLTWRIARASEDSTRYVSRQMEHLTRPFININISTRHKTVISIAISNGGKTSAKNVIITLDRPFYQFADYIPERNIQKFNIFSEPIPSIAPGDRFLIDLSQGFNLNKYVDEENITPDEFIIKVSYEFGEKRYEEENHIDLKPYFQTFAGEYEVEELIRIVKHLDSISSSLKKISSR